MANYSTKDIYSRQLKLRRQGIPSDLDPNASWTETKPHYYADARHLISRVVEQYRSFAESAPPLGILNHQGQPVAKEQIKRWRDLEVAMASTVFRAFNLVDLEGISCPYADPGLRNIGGIISRPKTDSKQEPSARRLLEVTLPGGLFAPATIVNIVKRIPAMAKIHGSTLPPDVLASNSSATLLHEPLHHPQQWAKAFSFCLASPARDGEDIAIDRNHFMDSEIIAAYTRLGVNSAGLEAVIWSRPTSEFSLLTNVNVADRSAGPEFVYEGEHRATYPTGTRLGEISVNEPTLGCPGSVLAYEMWHQTIEVANATDLWSVIV